MSQRNSFVIIIESDSQGGKRYERIRWARLAAALPDFDHLWDGEMDGTLSVYIGDGVLGAAILRVNL